MVMAMMGGDIQLAFGSWSAVGTQVKAGKIKPLATTGSQRFDELPNVPTTKEAGFPELNLTNWWLISAPKNINPKIVQKFYSAIKSILSDSQIKLKLGEIGHVVVGLDPRESELFIQSESLKYKNLIQKNGIKIDQ
jgi:tripartite-type tricarboxylate transporter receptor subunit TctC